MSYVLELTDSLARVLQRAAALPDHRVAGYAANVDFWLGEIQHRFDALRGYDRRFRAMRDATKDYVAAHPLDRRRADSADTGTTRSTGLTERSAARDNLTAAAQKFFTRCYEIKVLPLHLLPRIDELLQLDLSDAERLSRNDRNA